MKKKLSDIFTKNYRYSFFFIIIIFISQIKLNYTSTAQQCRLYNKCLLCKLCGSETNTVCDCEWDPEAQSCSKMLINNIKLNKWYNELSDCDENNEINNSDYCPSKKVYTIDDFEHDKIILNINKDRNNKYGKDFIYCYFEFVDENQAYGYNLTINYTSEINFSLNPKIILTIYTKESENNETTVEISENYEKYFNQLYKLTYVILLKAQYNIMPVSFILTKESKTNLVVIIVFSFIFVGVLFTIICCSTRYSNRRKRRKRQQLILLRAQRDLEHIQPVQIDSEVDQEVLKRENTEKLNSLFETRLAEHIYKKEYNQYGGGCSICLDNFNKKSKVSITSCNHVFHYKCIYEWLFKNILCPKCPNCNNEILKDNENNAENINENNDKGEISYEDKNINTNATKTIQIKKKDNNKKQMGDTSTQNEIIINGNSLAFNIRNNEGITSKRKMVNAKNDNKKKK